MPDSAELARIDPDANLVPVNTGTMTDKEIDRLFRIAKALALSRVFKDVNQAEQAFAKILIGRDLGLSPAQSLSSMDFVKGNVQLRAVTLAGFVKRHERYDYQIGTHTDKVCSIKFRELGPDGEWREAGVSSFTIEEAKTAGLLSKDGPWKTYPKNMLFARAMSNGVKWHCPDLMGGIPVYTEGDSFDAVDEDLTAAVGAVSAPVVLPEEVDAVVARAAKLGHGGLANRQGAAMATGGQPGEFVAAWCERAHATLDTFEQTITGTATELPDEPVSGDLSADPAETGEDTGEPDGSPERASDPPEPDEFAEATPEEQEIADRHATEDEAPDCTGAYDCPASEHIDGCFGDQGKLL